MSEQKHTKEPWFVTEAYDGDVAIRTTPEPSTNICGDGVIFENSGRSSGSVTPEDAARICACVNALAGLNPEAVGQVVAACKAAWHRLQESKRTGCGVFVGDEDLIQQLNDAILSIEGESCQK